MVAISIGNDDDIGHFIINDMEKTSGLKPSRDYGRTLRINGHTIRIIGSPTHDFQFDYSEPKHLLVGYCRNPALKVKVPDTSLRDSVCIGIEDEQDEVTHESFFGENIKRVLRALRNEK